MLDFPRFTSRVNRSSHLILCTVIRFTSSESVTCPLSFSKIIEDTHAVCSAGLFGPCLSSRVAWRNLHEVPQAQLLSTWQHYMILNLLRLFALHAIHSRLFPITDVLKARSWEELLVSY